MVTFPHFSGPHIILPAITLLSNSLVRKKKYGIKTILFEIRLKLASTGFVPKFVFCFSSFLLSCLVFFDWVSCI